MTGRLIATKIAVIGLGSALLVTAGLSFYRSRRSRAVVLGPGSRGEAVADYFEPLRGTANDCHIYVWRGANPAPRCSCSADRTPRSRRAAGRVDPRRERGRGKPGG